MTKSVGNSPRPSFFQRHFPVLRKASSESALDLAKGLLLNTPLKPKRERSLSQKVSSMKDGDPAALKRGRSFSNTVNPFIFHHKEKKQESENSSCSSTEEKSNDATHLPKEVSYSESSITSEESLTEETSDSDELYIYVLGISGDLSESKIE